MWRPGARKPGRPSAGGKAAGSAPAAEVSPTPTNSAPKGRILSASTLGMKFMQKRMQKDAEMKQQAEQAMAAKAAKWTLEQETRQAEKGASTKAQDKNTISQTLQPEQKQSSDSLQLKRSRTMVFETEETDPRTQVLGRRAFGGFNEVVARMFEQNLQLLGLRKGKRRRGDDDADEKEVNEHEMVERYRRHGNLPVKRDSNIGSEASRGGGGKRGQYAYQRPKQKMRGS